VEHSLLGVREFWDRLATLDPLWAILSCEEKECGRWKLNDFMRTGEREIALLWLQAERLGYHRLTTALDFGSGVGRISQALGRRCRQVVGVDISPRMTAIAEHINAYPKIVEYKTLDLDGIRAMQHAEFDFVYSNVVLQHLEPDTALAYLRELYRLTSDTGLLVFQLPSHRRSSDDPTIRPMPPDSYQAELSMLGITVASVAAGRSLSLKVVVKNISRTSWRQADVGSIRLGNQWWDAERRRLLIQDDGRANLPQLLPPDCSVEVDIEVRGPNLPGKYTLTLDLVHEGVAWFAEKGSRPMDVAVTVDPTGARTVASDRLDPDNLIAELDVPSYENLSLRGAPSATEPLLPVAFPMHGVPSEQVLELLGNLGGELLRLEDGLRAGPEWVDFRYFVRVRKPGNRRRLVPTGSA
jgi:SAM-dependent methyltransferase